MRLFIMLLAFLFFGQLHAQNMPPKNFKKGSLLLLDSTRLEGFVKENIHNRASLVFITNDGGKKKEYQGMDLLAAEIDSSRFICLRGDFFRIISEGNLEFVQKSSDASSIPSYNGNNAVFVNGTDGKPGDYFIYDTKRKELKKLDNKNVKKLVVSIFNGYEPALTMATKAYGDIPELKEAIDLYNKHLGQ